MDKHRIRKQKTVQIQYPAPYSQSWSEPVPEKKIDKPKKKTKKNSSSLQQNLFPGCCRRSKPKPLHGSDTCAPHLKYGIFPQQAQKAKNALNNININSSVRDPVNLSAASEINTSKGEDKKSTGGQLSDSPLFVIRSIDKRNRRQLSMSETLHLDIRPRKTNPRSVFKNKISTVFKNSIPKLNTGIVY